MEFLTTLIISGISCFGLIDSNEAVSQASESVRLVEIPNGSSIQILIGRIVTYTTPLSTQHSLGCLLARVIPPLKKVWRGGRGVYGGRWVAMAIASREIVDSRTKYMNCLHDFLMDLLPWMAQAEELTVN